MLWSQVLFLWQTGGDGSGLDGQMLSYPKDPEWKRLDLVFWYPFGDLTALGSSLLSHSFRSAIPLAGRDGSKRRNRPASDPNPEWSMDCKGKRFLLANVLRKPIRTGKIQQQFGIELVFRWYWQKIRSMTTPHSAFSLLEYIRHFERPLEFSTS